MIDSISQTSLNKHCQFLLAHCTFMNGKVAHYEACNVELAEV